MWIEGQKGEWDDMSWEDILKGAKIKMHFPTLRMKVAEWGETRREGKYSAQEIIDYVKEDVLKASVNEYIKKHPNPEWANKNRAQMETNFGKSNKWNKQAMMTKIGPLLKRNGFRQFPISASMRGGYTPGETLWTAELGRYSEK